MFVTCPDCKELHMAHPDHGLYCLFCWEKVEEYRGMRIYRAVMRNPAKDKDIPMWAWQSLDRKTKVGYSHYIDGWFVDVIAPDKYFATRNDWKVYDNEEEAGQRVADLYEAFLRLQEKKK